MPQFIRVLFWCLCATALFPEIVDASAITIGLIRCKTTNAKGPKQRLSIQWGQSCAGGRRCSSMLSITLTQKGRRYEIETAPRISDKELDRRQKILDRWRRKQSHPGTRRSREPRFRKMVFNTICRDKKQLYYHYRFRDDQNRWLQVEIAHTGRAYKFRVRAAYNRKARTKGWQHKVHCTWMSRSHIPSCRSVRMRKKRKKAK